MTHYEPPHSTEFEEIQELNLLFLIYLRSCAREGTDSLGLPSASAARLRQLSAGALETIAAFPRSLYTLRLDGATKMREGLALSHSALVEARQALTLTVLHSAWNMSRQRDFQARMFLRLPAATTRRLRTVSLSELPLLAATPGLLSADFPGSRSLWATLIDRSDTEMSRAFRLVALHPDADIGPVRHRVPQPAGSAL
jgi:hypothetical protein